MKVALHSMLRPGQEAAYEQFHAQIPPDVAEALRHAGITDWTIWRSGRNLFHLIDCEDLAAAFAELAEDPANQRWQDVMAGFVERFEGDGAGGPPALRLVWSLAVQAEDVHGGSPNSSVL